MITHRRRKRQPWSKAGYTLVEVTIAAGISAVIAVATMSAFVFGVKVFQNINAETRCRQQVVDAMNWMKKNLMPASQRRVCLSYQDLTTGVGAISTWPPSSPIPRYIRFFNPSPDDPAERKWHIVYWVQATRTLCHAEGATLPAPNPATDAWIANVDDFEVGIMTDGTVSFSIRIVPGNAFRGQTRSNWVEMSSRIFPRNYVEGESS